MLKRPALIRCGFIRCGFAAALLAAPAAHAEPSASPGSSIVVAGQAVEVGRPVVLWSDPQGFDGYQERCIDQNGGCCDSASKRYGARKGVTQRTMEDLQRVISQLVLHFDGCVNSRSCFKSMHNRPRPSGAGCGLSAHFMIDADGTIYQTMDLVERAFHAEEANSGSVGVEICNRGRVDRGEWPKLPAEYRTRPTREVIINGSRHEAYDFRPEQYDSIVALARTVLRVFPGSSRSIPERDGQPLMDTLDDPLAFAGIMGHLHVDLQKQKWDPGALDWRRILRALNGFEFPVQVRSFTEIPRNQRDLLGARRAVFFNAEERATGFFPLGAGRFWHSGVHLRAEQGAPVRAPTRGRVVAARMDDGAGPSSTSFVLIRHDLDVDGAPITFYSLLAHLGTAQAGFGGRERDPLVAGDRRTGPVARAQRAAAGDVVLLDQRVEAGDLVGRVGTVSRGPEQGSEVHFEIFTTERLPGDFGRTFRYAQRRRRRRDRRAAPIWSRRRTPTVISSSTARAAAVLPERQPRPASGAPCARRSATVTSGATGTARPSSRRLRELAGLSEPDRRRLYKMPSRPTCSGPTSCRARPACPRTRPCIRTTR